MRNVFRRTVLGAPLTFASNYSVLPLFVHHLTASNVALGLIPAVVAFGSFLPPILVAPALQRLRRRKPFILAWTVVERLPFLAIALLTLALAPAPAPSSAFSSMGSPSP